ncbi:Bin3-domain-containing protein [Hymenopellis radicata]|nr:Bin3-domain-containing protein [Hymenopellis radicata]
MSSTVPIHGNYHGYYSKRPAINDPRLALLPKDLFTGKRVLDVGCNEGHVTCEIAQRWGASKVVGVDIDDTLIRAAWRRRTTVWSSQGPSAQQGYFPACFDHSLGPLPIPSSHVTGNHIFPNNITFRTADWVQHEIPEDVEQYDVIIAFSITKWIHLNQGDDGIRTFFKRVWSCLRPGGTFVLEPQAWETYKKAKRINQSFKDKAIELALRPEGFEAILTEMGFSPAEHHGVIGDGGFRRPVDLYIKRE